MRLIKLKIQKFMAIDSFEADFENGSVVIFEGKNGTGKTAHLKAIQALFAGASAIPDVPIKHGSKKAMILGETETLICTRTFDSKGTKLTVRPNKKGAIKLTSPQGVLDELIGQFIDPLEFDRMAGDKRLSVLRGLPGVNLDFTEADTNRQALYEERTEVGRELKSISAQLDAIPEPVDEEEALSPTEILDAIAQREQVNDNNNSLRTKLREMQDRGDELCGVDGEPGEIARHRQAADSSELEVRDVHNHLEAEIKDLRAAADAEIAELQEAAAASIRSADKANAELTDLRAKGKPLGAEVELLEDQPTDDLRERLKDAEGASKRAAEANRRVELTAQVTVLDQKREELNEGITAIDQIKAAAIAEAEYPISGLKAMDDGVYLDGVPWDQCNASRRTIASTSIGFEVHPELKIVCVENASLLDDDARQTMREVAEAAGGQAFLEIVGSGNEVSVVIESGGIEDPVIEAARALVAGSGATPAELAGIASAESGEES